uniref:Secreted protein n=1 Tax=Oryza glaberrima TaxID=4538 RepID=I1P0L3_ORYGL
MVNVLLLLGRAPGHLMAVNVWCKTLCCAGKSGCETLLWLVGNLSNRFCACCCSEGDQIDFWWLAEKESMSGCQVGWGGNTDFG